MTDLTREKWLTDAADALRTLLIDPAIERTGLNFSDDFEIAVSIGHPKHKRAIGECWKREASEDQKTNHIFITPQENDSSRVLDVLLHELIHAYDNNESGHKGTFATLARAVGLEGKLTATVASPQLKEQLLDIIDALGPIPHHKLDAAKAGRKQQTNRNLLVFCGPLDQEGKPVKEGAQYGCGFKFNTSKSQIDRLSLTAKCPCCNGEWLGESIALHQNGL